MPVTIAVKSVNQPFQPSPEIQKLMETFRQMVNDCIRIGLKHDVSTMKQLSILAYQKLSSHKIISYYKSCAISHAAGILANRKKSVNRGLQPRKPYATRPLLVSCYGFKVVDGILKIPIEKGQSCDITLNSYAGNVLSDYSYAIHSFTLTPDSVSICYSKKVQTIECNDVVGLDRNLRNVTVGNRESTTQYDLSKAVEIAENTRSIMRSFKRKDARIRKRLYRQYGSRRKRRVSQLIHGLTKAIVQNAKENNTAIAFEDIRYIRKLYRKGNYQARSYRAKLNSWSFAEVKRQIEYKAKWDGIPIVQLSICETRGTSQLCPQCGKKITQVDRLTNQLYCAQCEKWMDRDMVAAMNISIKGLARFASSQGLAGEAMKRNPMTPVILRVDASKLTFRRKLRSSQNPL